MIESMFTTDEQKLLTQLLPYNEIDTINNINLYQIFDQQAPRLNQLSITELNKHLSELETNFGGSITSIFNLQPHDHVQLLDTASHYFQLLNGQPKVEKPAKEIIIKANQDSSQQNHIKSIGVSKDLKQLFISTAESPTNNKTVDVNSIKQLHLEFIALNKDTNQLMPAFNHQLTLDLNQWTNGQLTAQLLKFKYQLQNDIQKHHLVYVGHNLDNLTLTDNRLSRFDFLLEYFTGISNENDAFSYAYGIFNRQTQQLIYTTLDYNVAYNDSLTSSLPKYARYTKGQNYQNQNTLLNKFFINQVFQNEESYQKALSIISTSRLNPNEKPNLKAAKTTIKQLNQTINDQFEIKLILAQNESDLFKQMMTDYQLQTEYQQFDQDTYNDSSQNIYYTDTSNLNSNIFDNDPAVVKEYALTFFLYNYQYVAHHESLSEQFAQPIIKMIYAQQDLFQPNFIKSNKNAKDMTTDMFSQFNSSMQEFLQNLRFNNRHQDKAKQVQLIDILNYIHAVKHHQAITPQMMKLLVANDNQATNNQIALNEAYNAKLFDKMQKINNWQGIPALQKLSLKNRVLNVYAIGPAADNQTVNITPQAGSHQVTLVHGTQNFSLISILEKGLLTHHDLLDDNNQHYQYTGSALGDGIYFSRLDQAEKSANYTDLYDSTVNSFLFIADVQYNQIHEIQSYSDDQLTTNENLVWAHGVGSYDRDELVATSKEQVSLRYLVEIKPKK